MEKVDDGKWLYLPMETKVRELDAKLLLTYYAIQEDYKVVLGLSGMVEEALEHLPPGIFLDKGYQVKDKLKRFQRAKDNNHLIVNLEEEGFPLTERDLYINKYLSKSSLSLLDYEFCWGEVQEKVITSVYPFIKDKCFITGNSRFDLLDEKYQSLYKENVTKIRGGYGSFILVNAKFSLYTKSVDSDGKVNERVVRSIIKSYGEKLYKRMEADFKSFMTMIKLLSQRYPELNIVLRPHPSDNINTYNQELQGYKNVYIALEGNVVNWIMASKLVIHNACTTGVESFLLKKPVVSYMTTKDDQFDLPNELSIKLSNIGDLYSFIDNYMESYDFNKKQFDEGEKIRMLANYYSSVKGNYSYQNILHQLNNISGNIPTPSPSTINVSIKLRNCLIKESNKRMYHNNEIIKQKFPSLMEEEIIDFFNKLNEIERKKIKFNIRKLHDKLFEITKI